MIETIKEEFSQRPYTTIIAVGLVGFMWLMLFIQFPLIIAFAYAGWLFWNSKWWEK